MLGLASVGGIQVLLTPRTGIGGRLRGLKDFRRNVVLQPCLFGAEEIGVGWRRSETSLVDECAVKLTIFVPGRCAGVGKAHDSSGDIMMVLRCVAPSKLVPPSISDSRALRLALLSRGADRDRRLVQMWRAVVKLQARAQH